MRGYTVLGTPTAPTIDSFSQASFNSMLLLPPLPAADTCPLYTISVALDCFAPSIAITTVRRGGESDGKFVGEFECVCIQPFQIWNSLHNGGMGRPGMESMECVTISDMLRPLPHVFIQAP